MTQTAKTRRNKLLGLLHMAIKQRSVLDENYRDWLEQNFNVRSAANMTDDQLQEAVDYFRTEGWLDGRGRGASDREDRPTNAQWAKLAIQAVLLAGVA